MWTHALERLACSQCKMKLQLLTAADEHPRFSESSTNSVPSTGEARWVESGALVCEACRVIFPIQLGVPVLLGYWTRQAEAAFAGFPAMDRTRLLNDGYHLASGVAPEGEEFVSASFSTEWSDYDYGATLWTAPTNERIATFHGECGVQGRGLAGQRFVEIGCGLGILTNEAATGMGAEAWGVDLSTAVFRAAQQFRENQNVHFVQASAFSLPFREHEFDFLYSHGVLHHTWSTREALKHVANLVRSQGWLYVWLYGYDDVRVNLARQLAYSIESFVRPIIAKMPPTVATAVLLPTIPAYKIASIMGKRSNTHATIYSSKQALHAARDRFTPLFAHRHEGAEVAGWLREFGFGGIQKVGPQEVSASWSLAIERNVALRATRS